MNDMSVHDTRYIDSVEIAANFKLLDGSRSYFARNAELKDSVFWLYAYVTLFVR